MSDGSQERLKAFREQYARPQSRMAWLFSLVQLGLMLAGFCAIFVILLKPAPQQQSAISAGLNAETQRRLAVYLSEKNDADAAINAYQDYLKGADITLPERTKILFAMAKLALDNEKYEQALPYLYQAEFLDPKSEVKDEISKKIVLCLDKLGRKVDLRHELRDRSNIKRKKEDVQPGEKVLAEFGDEVITDRDLEQELEKIPASMRDSFTGEKKVELLKNVVAQKLLLDKARRLELDKSPEIQDQLIKALDSLIVQKLITDEVRAGVQITPEDVERYYKAETARFTEPATAEVLMAKADSEDAAKNVKEFKEKPITVAKDRPIPGTPENLNASDAIFAAEPGSIAGPVKAEDGWYVFKVNSKKPENVLPFEQVKDRAAKMLQAQKEQEKFTTLIEQTLQSRDVKLYPERLQETEKK